MVQVLSIDSTESDLEGFSCRTASVGELPLKALLSLPLLLTNNN